MDYTPFRGRGQDPSLRYPHSLQPNPIRSRYIITWSPGAGRYPKDVCYQFVFIFWMQIIKPEDRFYALGSFFDLFAYVSATCDAQGQIDSKQVHEYRKLRNSILSGYLPGGICEATSEDDVMMTTYMYETVHAQYCRMV